MSTRRYVNAQSGGTQLVTTQRAYLDAEWAIALARHGDATLLTTGTGVRSIDASLASPFGSPIPPSVWPCASTS